VGRNARAAGREHEPHAVVVGEPREQRPDRAAVVPNGLAAHLKPGLLAPLRELGAGHVLAVTRGDRGGDRDDRGAHRGGLLAAAAPLARPAALLLEHRDLRDLHAALYAL